MARAWSVRKRSTYPTKFYTDWLRRQGQPGGPSSCSPTTGVDIERWQRGDYEVDIVVDKRLVATGTFRMDEKDRIYQATTRDVNWELDLSHPPPHRWLPLTIEALLFYRDAAGERVVQRKVLQSAVPADWSDTHHTDFFGWEDDYYFYRSGATTRSPGRWLPGMYRVDLHVGNSKIATGSFELR